MKRRLPYPVWAEARRERERRRFRTDALGVLGGAVVGLALAAFALRLAG